jgi:mRNA interferase MazF
MQKDFDGWNADKKRLHGRSQPPFFHEREIWWCALGVNVGSEQDGTGDQFSRPVLVVKKFSRDVLWVLPLTTQEKLGQHYFPLKPWKSVQSTAVLSQLRLISAKRLLRRVPQRISEQEYDDLTNKLFALLQKKRSPSCEGVSEANGH